MWQQAAPTSAAAAEAARWALVLCLLCTTAGVAQAQQQQPAQRQAFNCRSQNGLKVSESVQAQAGTLSDGPGGIRSNTWCEWAVSVPPAAPGGAPAGPRRVRLTFRTVQLMPGEDFIWVFDDAVSKTVPVQRLTGTNTPGVIYSASEAGLRVEYRSSEFGNGVAVAEEQGFDADFDIVGVKGVCNPSPCAEQSVCIEDDAGGHRCTRCPIGYTGDGSQRGGCRKVAPCPTPIVRRDLRLISAGERDLYVGALQAMRRSGLYDEIMWVHADKFNFNYAHLTDGFLPWHREYLLMMEDALRSVSPETNCLAIPFWDWTVDAANPMASIVWRDDYFGGNGVDVGNGKKCVRSGPFAWSVLGNDCLQRDLNGAGFFATREEILNTIASNDNYRDFSRALELFHDTVHRFIGGTMVLDNSADEPLFFLHHSFIDMLWSVWQDCHDYDLVPAASVRPGSNVFMGGYETGALGTVVNTDYNSVMPYRLSHYNPQVTPAGVHDIRKLGYSYDNMHILSRPMTIEWFDPRWTTCTIENLEAFKAAPDKFASAATNSKSFQVLRQDDADAAVAVVVPGRKGSPATTMPPRALYNGPTMFPDLICAGSYINFADMCACMHSMWSGADLRHVAQTLPSCQRDDVLSCVPGRPANRTHMVRVRSGAVQVGDGL